MAYRKRRRKGTWFPTLGNKAGTETNLAVVSGLDDSTEVKDNGVVTTIIRPLTLDAPREDRADNEADSLADAVGSEWFLQRIVGKFLARLSIGASENAFFQDALVAAGFFVGRADPDTNVPIGAGSGDDASITADYSPLDVRTMREPWIWRRCWILSWYGANPSNQSASVPFAQSWPKSTAFYGSVLDGPHIDAKTKRRITSDDRLWFALSTCRWPVLESESEEGQPLELEWHLDYRLFGGLRKARNRGVF